MRPAAIALLAGTLGLAPGALAQEVGQEVGGPSPEAGEPRAREQPPVDAVVLTLNDVLEQALYQNFSIRSSRWDVRSSDAAVMGSRGPFDPVASFFYQHSRNVQPQASTLEAPTGDDDVEVTETLVGLTLSDFWSVGLSQKLWYGATYDVSVQGTRSESNRPFLAVNPSYSVDVTLTYTQPLLQGFGRDANRTAIERALNSARIARNSFLVQVREVANSVIDAYWELVFAMENLEVARASLELAESLLRKNRIMVDVGTLAPLEVVQAEASVAEREQAIIDARTAVRDAEDALKQLMGVPEGSSWWHVPIVPAERPEFRTFWVDLSEAIDEALQRREELDSAQLQAENSRLQLAQDRDGLLPQLDLEVEVSTAGLSGDITQQVDTDGDTIPDTFVKVRDVDAEDGLGDAFSQVGDRRFDSWAASLRFSHPLGNRAAKAGYLSSRYQLEQDLINVTQVRQDVVVEVRQAVRELERAREQVVATRVSRELQEKTLEAEIKKFENGLSTNFEVLEFQTDLTQAESAELRAIIDHAKAVAALLRARGRLLSAYGLVPLE